MGLLSVILGVPRPPPPQAPENRSANPDLPFGMALGSVPPSARGRARAYASPHQVEALSSALACIELVSSAIASLPPGITADGPSGQVPAPPTATAWALLARPNRWQSWPSFMAGMVASILLRGNSLSIIRRDGRGAVVGLVPARWDWLTVSVIAGAAGQPRLAYDLTTETEQTRALGLRGRYLDDEVLHIRGRSDDGLIGRSVLDRASAVFHEGADLSTIAGSLWRNGMRPGAVLELPKGVKLSDAAHTRLKIDITSAYGGASNAGLTPVLEDGATLKTAAMTSADAQFLQSREFSVAEVARLFNVPLGLLAPGSGVQPYEAMMAAFAQTCLAPIVATIEGEFNEVALPAGMRLSLDLGGLQRGNFSGQVAALCAATQSGIITGNDARAALGWPPHPDGNTLRPGNAPAWPADGKGMPHLGPSPGATGTGLPDPGTNANQGAGG